MNEYGTQKYNGTIPRDVKASVTMVSNLGSVTVELASGQEVYFMTGEFRGFPNDTPRVGDRVVLSPCRRDTVIEWHPYKP